MGAGPAPDEERIRVNITSEYSPLKTVLLHKPGLEIDRLTPENRGHLLFEDIPYLKTMEEEYDAFVDVLRGEGVRVLFFADLLLDILKMQQTRAHLVDLCCSAASEAFLTNVLLDHFSEERIREVLLGGITANELYDETNMELGRRDEIEDPFILEPIPNAYFMRDPAAAVESHIISCKMHYPARVRESIIVREIFRSHPLFTGNNILYGDCGKEDRPYTIEGGDIMIISPKAVAVGASQRTRSESIRTLAERLFDSGIVERVYEVSIPGEREYMHLDTVFTIIDEGLIVAYPDVMNHVTTIRRYVPSALPGVMGEKITVKAIDENRSFNTILQEEFGGRLKVIHTGNNLRRFAAREQRAYGTNVFAVKPGIVVTYDRNTKTREALEAEGIKVIPIRGSELVRGLGGPRCMTMPLQRDDVKARPLDQGA